MKIGSISFSTALIGAMLAIPVAGQSSGYLKTTVNPGRAGVFIDGKYVGPAANFGKSRKYPVGPGQHEVKLAEPRYEEVVKNVTIESGKTLQLSETMKALPVAKPPFGRLRTISPDKFTAVYINGKFMGHADEFNNPGQGLLLNPGEYTLKLVPVGATDGREEKVNIEANKVIIVRANK